MNRDLFYSSHSFSELSDYLSIWLTQTPFSDLKSVRCSSIVEARLHRFGEARNFKRGGDLMWMDLLLVDVYVSVLF